MSKQSAIVTFLNRDVMTDAMQSKARAEHAALVAVATAASEFSAYAQTGYNLVPCAYTATLKKLQTALANLAAVRAAK